MCVQYVNKICPICHGYIYINSNNIELCENCNYVLSSSAHKYCSRCNAILKQDGDWNSCSICGYGYNTITGAFYEAIKEAPKQDIIVNSLSPSTLTITNCEKFKVQLKELDVEFELEPDKLANIDTLIINGYKYIKEKC